MKNQEAFCKFFFDPDLGQIVMMKKQNEQGEPEIRFWFDIDGGVWSVAIGWEKQPEKRSKQAFALMTQDEVVGICKGWMAKIAPDRKH